MLQELLPWVAIALQWARAQQKFKEVFFVVIAVGFATLMYVLSDPAPFAHPARDIFFGIFHQLQVVFATVGMTSSVARIAVESGAANASSQAIPVTSSK